MENILKRKKTLHEAGTVANSSVDAESTANDL